MRVQTRTAIALALAWAIFPAAYAAPATPDESQVGPTAPAPPEAPPPPAESGMPPAPPPESVPPAPPPPVPPEPPVVEAAPPVAPPPPAPMAQANAYPPCSATVTDQCTNTRKASSDRGAGKKTRTASKRKPR